jgi:hypothetical protein
MNSDSNTVTIWQSGKLAPHVGVRRIEFGRQHWLGAGLLVLAAIVLALFVAVLEQDVDRGEMQHATQRARAVAEARCEADQPAPWRGRCIALFNGDALATAAAPQVTPGSVTLAEDDAARATTVSLVTADY